MNINSLQPENLSSMLFLLPLFLSTAVVASLPPASVFPIGWYDLPPQNTTPHNVALFYNDGYNASKVKSLLDELIDTPVVAIVELPRVPVRAGDSSAVIEFVDALKFHPALFAWYLWDEPHLPPDPGYISNITLAHVYDAIKQADPHHNVTIVMSGYIDQAPSYRSSMDILMHDNYPCLTSDNNPPGGPGIEKWYQDMVRTSTDAASFDALWLVPQGYGGGQFGHRNCLQVEERFMIHSALQNGATGLLFWRFARANTTWVQSQLNPIVNEVIDMLPAVMGGALDVNISSNDSSSMNFRAYQYPSHIYTFTAIRNSSVPGNVTIFPNTLPTTSVSLVRFGKTIKTLPCTGGFFVDYFEPFDVHIYNVLI
eukprot:m.133475 g.133475  ORF g.133475 m.133475 type:complete len:369 (+) comp23819_c0_seq1:43-1149(+)